MGQKATGLLLLSQPGYMIFILEILYVENTCSLFHPL